MRFAKYLHSAERDIGKTPISFPRRMSHPLLTPLQMVSSLSGCKKVDLETMVNCLQGKSEEEILAINKVSPNGHGCRSRVATAYGAEGLQGLQLLGHRYFISRPHCLVILDVNTWNQTWDHLG